MLNIVIVSLVKEESLEFHITSPFNKKTFCFYNFIITNQHIVEWGVIWQECRAKELIT